MLDHATPMPKPRVIAGEIHDWELVIGMEVHAQVASAAKLFSGAPTGHGGAPNDHVAFVDAGMPGMLPVINEFCVAQAVRTGLGLKAEIHLESAFDRKNYFYPDLPQGYQISQLYHPIVGEGEVLVEMGDGTARTVRTVRIERIHLEQDAGKSIHDMDPALSFVDLNRTGVALMEIVSRPDIRGPGGGGGLRREAAPDPALPRHLRRQHAERQPARRRERLGLPAGRSTRSIGRRRISRIWARAARSRT